MSRDSGRLTQDNAIVAHLSTLLTSSKVTLSVTFFTLFEKCLVQTSTTKHSNLTAGFWFPSDPPTFLPRYFLLIIRRSDYYSSVWDVERLDK